MPSKKPRRPKDGRPPIEELNPDFWQEFDKLCTIQCTLSEMAVYFQCDMDTIEAACKRVHKKTFGEIYAQKRKTGFISLRRRQWAKALQDGNPTMLIWLGKQYLDQADNLNLSGEVGHKDLVEQLEARKKAREGAE